MSTLRMTGTGIALALVAALAAPAGAQGLRPVQNGSVFQLTPYAGFMMFGKFLEGPVGTSLSTKNSPVYGAQLGVQVAPNVALYGNVGYASTNLQVGAPILGHVNVGDSKVWMYDGGLQLDIPVSEFSPVKPFVQAGAGAMHYDIMAANLLNTTATNFAWNAGAGFDIKVAPSIGIRLMAKDYVGKFNFQDATSISGIQGRTAQNWVVSGGLRIGF
jgi:hypothetical protein